MTGAWSSSTGELHAPVMARAGMELALETGGAFMPRSRPVKRLSDGELAELRAQLIEGRVSSTSAGSSIRQRGTLRRWCWRASRTGRGASAAAASGASRP